MDANIAITQVRQYRIGGAEDLPDRAVAALIACRDVIGKPPTAKRYNEWRMSLSEDERTQAPSLTAIVPIAFPTWGDARRAAGFGSAEVRRASHGPRPKWTHEECVGVVREWLAGGGSGTIAEFQGWIDGQRAHGRLLPSVSTVRLRLRAPWSGIVAQANGGAQ